MKIFYLVSDNGDGSASVFFFKDEAKANVVAENNEQFNLNEGGSSEFEITGDVVDPSGHFFSDDDYADDGSDAE